MSEPTSVLTFADLLIDISEKIGCPYYGADGTEAAQVPIDPQNLDLCKRIVNKAIRMFISDAPKPNGWRWLRPVASLVLWPSVAVDAANPILTAVHVTGVTTIVVTSAAFYPSMELKNIVITGVGTFPIASYISATSVTVTGNASAAHASSKTFSIEADGNYTLPADFGGQFTGHPTFSAGTNRGSAIEYTDESVIRELRANVTASTGTPYLMAVRVMSVGSPRRRHEALFYSTPAEVFTVQFPYVLHFQSLVATTEVSPAPFGHDEAIKAAARAVAEKDVEDSMGMEWDYYRKIALQNSYLVDAQSAPKQLGYFGNGRGTPMTIHTFRDGIYQRPTVTVNL